MSDQIADQVAALQQRTDPCAELRAENEALRAALTSIWQRIQDDPADPDLAPGCVTDIQYIAEDAGAPNFAALTPKTSPVPQPENGS